MVEKCYFLQVLKISYPKNRLSVTLRSFFSTYNFFPGQKWFFPANKSEEECVNEKVSSLAGLKKS